MYYESPNVSIYLKLTWLTFNNLSFLTVLGSEHELFPFSIVFLLAVMGDYAGKYTVSAPFEKAFQLNNNFSRFKQVSKMHIYHNDGIQEGKNKRYESVNKKNNNQFVISANLEVMFSSVLVC